MSPILVRLDLARSSLLAGLSTSSLAFGLDALRVQTQSLGYVAATNLLCAHHSFPYVDHMVLQVFRDA